MAARATSSATISFGLVSIPIKVYTATSSKAVRFSMLHETDKSRLKQSYTCRECEETVERSETVKGYEYARDQYVVLTEDELKALEKQSDKTIDIEAFVPLAEVDPVKASVVEMRFFGGLTEAETAAVMGCSSRTVTRHWKMAKAWLLKALDEPAAAGS